VRTIFIPLVLVSSACMEAAEDRAHPLRKQVFEDVADAHDVPRDLLVAIAWSQTRFEQEAEGFHQHEGRRGFGVMGLEAGAPEAGPNLARAARRLGVAPDEIRHDSALNVEAAASELRWKADQMEKETGVAIVDMGDWAEIVGWFSGSEDGGAQRSFAKQVFQVLESGLEAPTPDGEWIEIYPSEQDTPFLNAWLTTGGGDSALVTNFVAAHSSNYTNSSRSSGSIDTIVVHTAQGSYSGTYNWFANSSSNVSAHYVIRSSDGEITQMVWEEDSAWHAGHSDTNSNSVGIELEGYIEQPDTWFTEAMYRSLSALIEDIGDRQRVELDRDAIIGHVEVPGCSSGYGGGRSCHTDPGTGFDWDRLMSDLDMPPESEDGGSEPPPTGTTGALVGYVRADSIYNDTGGISNATVSLSTGENTTTESDGWYQFDAVASEWVDISVSASGYDNSYRSKEIQTGATNWGSVAMNTSSGGTTGGGTTGGGTTGGGTTGPSVPTTVSPVGSETVVGPAVTLRWSNTGADGYEVKIYWFDGEDWNYYYDYSTTLAEKTFWPVVDDTSYTWAARAIYGGVATEWTDLAEFYFDN